MSVCEFHIHTHIMCMIQWESLNRHVVPTIHAFSTWVTEVLQALTQRKGEPDPESCFPTRGCFTKTTLERVPGPPADLGRGCQPGIKVKHQDLAGLSVIHLLL